MRWLAAVLMLCATVAPAWAHDWYDPWCCHNKDCAPASSVEPSSDGGVVIWENGVPFQVPKSYPFRPSRDANWHICILNGQVRCVYMPAGT